MKEVATIGLDLAKSVFQVHGVDVSGRAVIRRRLRRRQVLPFFKKLAPCLVGMEACATSHYWAREIAALGHEVRMMPAQVFSLASPGPTYSAGRFRSVSPRIVRFHTRRRMPYSDCI